MKFTATVHVLKLDAPRGIEVTLGDIAPAVQTHVGMPLDEQRKLWHGQIAFMVQPNAQAQFLPGTKVTVEIKPV